MAKLGPRKYPYTLAVLSWLYAVRSQITLKYFFSYNFPFWLFSVTLLHISAGTFGIIALSKETAPVMKIVSTILKKKLV